LERNHSFDRRMIYSVGAGVSPTDDDSMVLLNHIIGSST
jgi:hypothetical protein